ncbi:hypothetical protein M0P65_04580 [Candidatus Gracilibacteria bacterium]|nr:hypothetical protein [Candidatus Gracilibacteria bacterium]
MLKLTIEITSKTSDFTDSLNEVKKQIQSGFISGFNENEEEKYSFEVL